MARKGAQRSDPRRRPGSPAAVVAPRAPASLEGGLAVVLALSFALALTILYVDARLTTDRGYTSFCAVSTRINCDAALTSPYGRLLGQPVALWAILTYAALGMTLVVRRRAGEVTRTRATLGLLALGVWSLVFSLYMAAVAAFAIRVICLLCSGLYVLNGAIAVLAWRIARAEATSSRPLLTARGAAVGVSAMVAALAVTAGSQLRTSAAARGLTPAEVETMNPDFYKWYMSLPVVDAVPAGEHVRGPADAMITVVEYSDFECPYCGRAFRDLRDLERQHAGMIRVEFHHFPLDSTCNTHVPETVHRSACDAAIAAECAGRLGRFWEYHDRLFSEQDRLTRDDLVQAAVDLGIDRTAFIACLDGPAARGLVVADATEGARIGVKTTPTLFINRRAVEGALDRTLYDYVLALERHS